jgi:tetratricopeptide (TPR) repeat protein
MAGKSGFSTLIVRPMFALLVSISLLTGCACFKNFALAPRERRAQKEFDNQNYAIAALQYSHLHRIHPDPAKKEHFLIQKAYSLYQMQAYFDAQLVLEEYLREFPEGTQRDLVEIYITRLAALQDSIKKMDACIIEEAKGDVTRLDDLITSDPYNAELHYELANTYWSLEEYDKAAKEYLTATEIDAALKENDLIKRRMMIDQKGNVVPITPEMQREIERNENPLVIFDVSDYGMRENRDFYSARQVYMNVTGKIRNQGDRAVRGVVIEITFYNVHREVLDVKHYNIGLMRPGEIRGFVVRSSFADDMGNINSYNFDTIYY